MSEGTVIAKVAVAAVHSEEYNLSSRKGVGTSCAIAAARAFAAVVAHQADMPEAEYKEGCRRLAAKSEFLALRVWQEVWCAIARNGGV